MPTIQDVAKQAGAGAATVSRVLSGKGYVKSETREPFQTLAGEAVRLIVQLIQGRGADQPRSTLPVTLCRGGTTEMTR